MADERPPADHGGDEDSPKISMAEFLESLDPSGCMYQGNLYPAGTKLCLIDELGMLTWHTCMGVQWVSTGEVCDTEDQMN